MCGIAGIFGQNNQEFLRKMLSQLVHRGPDDEHLVSRRSFSLGARRLSIIDLDGGRQPLANEDETVWVAQNGEIYNFPILMESLKKAGHHFRSRSDTEVLAHHFEEKGERFLEDLNGMYAIAVWDDKKGRGILARDRVGKKPLYYHLHPSGALYFASEIKALLALPFFSRKISWPALHYYLSYKHVPAPLSIFAGIHCLPPAHYLIYSDCSDDKSRVEIKRYWKLDFSKIWTASLSEEEIVAGLLEELRNCVSRRLISDVPVGFFLSGGIDSGLCTALAAELSGDRIDTFTLTFGPDSTTPAKERDRECAAWVSRKYNTRHHQESIEATSLEEDLHEIIRHFDEPFAGVISTYFLARRISRHVKVAVSGDGADELFGSYLSHRLALPIYRYTRAEQSASAERALDSLDDRDRTILKRIAAPEDWGWRYDLSVFSDQEKLSIYSADTARQMENLSTPNHLRSYFLDLTARDPLNRILEAEFYSQLPDQVLSYVDRLSMAHSLEVRAPYLDFRFLELAAGIEGSWKIKEGETKYILKKAALRYLPEELVFRPKEGFLLPINQWLLTNMEPYVRSCLSTERLNRHGVFDPARVGELMGQFYRGESGLGTKIWTLMAFQIWFESYFDTGEFREQQSL